MTTPVSLPIATDLVDLTDGQQLASLYLPDSDSSNRWSIETFRWLPSDETLAALPFALVPDSDSLVHGDPTTGPVAYVAQVALVGLADEINPGSTLGYLAGGLAGVRIRIKRKTLAIEVSLDRRLGTTGLGGFGFTYADAAADFPTVTYADVDPAVTYFDARIAHP